MQVFSALIVIIAGAFIITIIYRSVLSFSEPHLQTREGEELDGAGGRLPSLAMGDEERSEERRVGKECLRLCRSRWSPYH